MWHNHLSKKEIQKIRISLSLFCSIILICSVIIIAVEIKTVSAESDTEDGSITNDPPLAYDKWVTTNVNTPIDITLPSSDQDQNDRLTASITISPLNGKLSDMALLT